MNAASLKHPYSLLSPSIAMANRTLGRNLVNPEKFEHVPFYFLNLMSLSPLLRREDFNLEKSYVTQ